MVKPASYIIDTRICSIAQPIMEMHGNSGQTASKFCDGKRPCYDYGNPWMKLVGGAILKTKPHSRNRMSD